VREKFTCPSCEAITRLLAPFYPIARGRAGPNLLAQILASKFCDHQPLNRRSDRADVDNPRSLPTSLINVTALRACTRSASARAMLHAL